MGWRQLHLLNACLECMKPLVPPYKPGMVALTVILALGSQRGQYLLDLWIFSKRDIKLGGFEGKEVGVGMGVIKIHI